eukprot:g61157.t1
MANSEIFHCSHQMITDFRSHHGVLANEDGGTDSILHESLDALKSHGGFATSPDHLDSLKFWGSESNFTKMVEKAGQMGLYNAKEIRTEALARAKTSDGASIFSSEAELLQLAKLQQEKEAEGAQEEEPAAEEEDEQDEEEEELPKKKKKKTIKPAPSGKEGNQTKILKKLLVEKKPKKSQTQTAREAASDAALSRQQEREEFLLQCQDLVLGANRDQKRFMVTEDERFLLTLKQPFRSSCRKTVQGSRISSAAPKRRGLCGPGHGIAQPQSLQSCA